MDNPKVLKDSEPESILSESQRKKKLLTYALDRKAEGWRVVLVPAGEKKGGAVSKGWSTRKLTDTEITNHVKSGGNLGGVPPEDVAVLDVDKHGDNDGTKSLVVLVSEFKLQSILPTTRTPSGGFHFFLKVPAEKREGLEEYIGFRTGLDLLYKTKFAIFPYSKEYLNKFLKYAIVSKTHFMRWPHEPDKFLRSRISLQKA